MTAPDLDAIERRHRLVSHLHEWRVDGGQIWARDYSGCVGVSWRRIGEIRDPDVRDFVLHADDDIAALIARLREAERQRDEARAALETISESHIPSMPMTAADDELVWAQRHVAHLRRIALSALPPPAGSEMEGA